MDEALRRQWRMTQQDQRISETVSREYARLRNFIRKRVADQGEAEDILQDVFYELIEAYRMMKPVEQVTAWLFRVARNRIIDLLRRKQRETQRSEPASLALFLTWRLIATPWELDRERQRFIDGLTQKLAYTRLELIALRASPPAIDVEILEIHVQAADTTHSMHASDLPVDCDIFLRLKLTLRDTRPIGLLAYELSSVLHGNSSRADFVDDIQDWGLVTEKKPIGVGTTFHYTVVRLTKLAHQLEERGVPVEGWIHFSVTAVHEREIGATIYRLIVLTPNGGNSAEIAGTKNLAGLAGGQIQKNPHRSPVRPD